MRTAVREMMDDFIKNGTNIDFAKYLNMEREQIQAAVIHGVEQYAHDSTWKVFIAQNYYNEQHLGITGLPGGDK
jgi:hypothetical protein